VLTGNASCPGGVAYYPVTGPLSYAKSGITLLKFRPVSSAVERCLDTAKASSSNLLLDTNTTPLKLIRKSDRVLSGRNKVRVLAGVLYARIRYICCVNFCEERCSAYHSIPSPSDGKSKASRKALFLYS
jgi:hypothetical protein